jgi:hypothetical protein
MSNMEHAGIAHATTVRFYLFPISLDHYLDANTRYTVTQAVSAMLPIPNPAATGLQRSLSFLKFGYACGHSCFRTKPPGVQIKTIGQEE